MRYLRQILAVLIGLGLIILIFVLVARGFSSGKPSSPVPQTDLVTYASTNATATLYIDGPINGDADHNTVQIIVGQTQVTINILKGYDGTVTATQTYSNNESAYAVFLQALNHLNFTKGDTSPKNADERGYCATGDRYIYQFANNGSNLFRYWSTSCGQGTFSGSRSEVISLFQSQIPITDYNNLTNSLNI